MLPCDVRSVGEGELTFGIAGKKEEEGEHSCSWTPNGETHTHHMQSEPSLRRFEDGEGPRAVGAMPPTSILVWIFAFAFDPMPARVSAIHSWACSAPFQFCHLIGQYLLYRFWPPVMEREVEAKLLGRSVRVRARTDLEERCSHEEANLGDARVEETRTTSL